MTYLPVHTTSVAAPQVSGLFNVLTYGAIGDGSPHPLSNVASWKGASSAGWSLAQWQAVFPHATALSNELDWCAGQAALNAARSANGGVAYWPASKGLGYRHDQELVVPLSPAVHMRGDGLTSTLFWPADLGTGKFMVRTDVLGNPEPYIEIASLALRGALSTTIGVAPYQMSGIRVSNAVHVTDCWIRGAYAGGHITGDHGRIVQCSLEQNYYNLYWSSGGDTFGNHYVQFCSLTGALLASVACSWDNGIDTSAFYSCHLGFSPYGMFKELAPSGQTPRAMLTNSTLVDVSFESCGNGAIFDANADVGANGGLIAGNLLANVNFAMSNASDPYHLSARSTKAVVVCGDFLRNEVTGPQNLFVTSTAAGRVSQALFVSCGAIGNNNLGPIDGILNDWPSTGLPALAVSADSANNRWRSNNASGVFARLFGASAVVPGGSLVRATYGALGCRLYGGAEPIIGALMIDGQPDGLVPVATAGTAPVRKTANAASGGSRVFASLTTLGSVEGANNQVSQPFVGVAEQDAAAGSTTLSVRLEIENPRYFGALPTLTYARSGENAAQTQLRTALVALGLVVDQTAASSPAPNPALTGPSLAMTTPTWITSGQKYGSGAFDALTGSGWGDTPATIFPATGPFTLECWIKIAQANINPGFSSVAMGSSGLAAFAVATDGTAKFFAGGNAFSSGTALANNAWHHLALVCPGLDNMSGNFVLYADGVQVQSGAGPAGSVTNLPIRVGNWSNPRDGELDNQFRGQIDEAAVFSGARYTGNFTVPAAPYIGTESGLLGLWHLDGNGLSAF